MQIYGFLEKAQLENTAADLGNTLAGLVWFNTTTSRFKFYDSGAIRTVVDENSTQTLTGKTLTGNLIASFSPDGAQTLTAPVATDTLVALAVAQTLSNKTLVGPITDFLEFDHQTTPATPGASKNRLYFKSDNQLYGLDSNGVEFPIGASRGDLNTLYTENFDTFVKAADLTAGNNASFDGGGALDGALADETVTPLNGLSSIKYTAGASSANDYFHTGAISVPVKSRGNFLSFSAHAKYDGAADTMEMILFDDTTNEVLDRVSINSSEVKQYVLLSLIPLATTSVKVGFQAKSGITNGDILEFVDFQIDQNPFKDVIESGFGDWKAFTPPSSQGLGTLANIQLYYREAGENVEVFGTVTTGTTSAVEAQLGLPNSWTVSNDFTTNIFDVGLATQDTSAISADDNRILATPGDAFVNFAFSGSGALTPQNGSAVFGSTQNLSIYFKVPVNELQNNKGVLVKNSAADNSFLRLTGSNDHGSTNNKIRRFLTQQESQGSAITYTDSATDGATFTIEQDGVYAITYTEHTTSGSETAFGLSLNSASLTTNIQSLTAAEVLAIGEVDADANASQYAVVSYEGAFKAGDVIRAHTNGVNATGTFVSFSISKIGVSQVTGVPFPKVAFIEDVKAANTVGGTPTAGSFVTRDLNTLTGDTSFVTLASNQFTLSPGKYRIEASAPAFLGDRHKAKLRNITDSTDDAIGTSEFADAVANRSQTRSFIDVVVEITDSKTYEIQHRLTSAAGSTRGFGVETNVGVSEVYTKVKVTKVE